MNKEEILQYVAGKNGNLIGFFHIPFPVYVVHTSYDSLDSDPMFPLDRAILRYVKYCPKMDKTPYFAQLIGFEKEMVDQRIKLLKNDGMIYLALGNYKLTESAERKYLTANSRPTVRVTGSFIVDGKTLKLLPSFVYEGSRRLVYREYIASAHLPLDLSLDASPAARVIKHLNSPTILEMLHLENTGENFEVLDMEKRFLAGACAVFYFGEDLRYHKEIVYNGKSLQSEATGSAQAYTIELSNRKDTSSWKFTSNMGYNVSDAADMMNKVIVASNEGWSSILAERYGTPDFVFQLETNETTQLPCICITESLLKAANMPLDVIEDAATGYIDFPVGSDGVVRIMTKNYIQPFVTFKEKLYAWYRGGNSNDKQIVSELKELLPDWRKWMVRFKLYEELEKIDCNCFIFNK